MSRRSSKRFNEPRRKRAHLLGSKRTMGTRSVNAVMSVYNNEIIISSEMRQNCRI